MSTRSDIIVERADGKWARIYCHYDGYLEGVGAILAEHYNSQERAEAVVAPGDMSSLAPSCDKPDGHSFDTRVKGYCVYYGRDRGEEDTQGKIGKSLKAVWPKDSGTEYTYVWKRRGEPLPLIPMNADPEGAWYVGDPDKRCDELVPLAEALAGINPPTPDIKAFGVNFVIGKRA